MPARAKFHTSLDLNGRAAGGKRFREGAKEMEA
jgi:hypothetical protein